MPVTYVLCDPDVLTNDVKKLNDVECTWRD